MSQYKTSSASIQNRKEVPAKKMGQRILFACGIVSSLLYVAMNILAAVRYEGYNSNSQLVSELSAIGAPTRQLWVILGAVYTLLVAAFGCGVWRSAVGNRPIRITGALIFAYGIIGLFWPPMHQRTVLAAGGKTLTDTMHIVFTAVTVILMMLAIGFSAALLGKRFRLYSILTILLLFAFGAVTGTYASRVEANLPTPWAGVWERINIGVFLLWIIVLAILLWRRENVRVAIFSGAGTSAGF